jgi:KaiC/GvpD/RAD55 family RecA-like ATPase
MVKKKSKKKVDKKSKKKVDKKSKKKVDKKSKKKVDKKSKKKVDKKSKKKVDKKEKIKTSTNLSVNKKKEKDLNSLFDLKKESVKSGRKSKRGRLFTGIPNFDRLIEGGFEKYSTSLVVGGSGVGKTIFATQFLIGGMKKGEKCLYVTFEEDKEQFYFNMKEFGWDLDSYEKKGLFSFLEYTPIKVKTMLEEGGGEIEGIILREKISRLVIDSITSFELLFEDELSKREAALSLFGMLRGWDVTSLLTLEQSALEGKLSSRTLEFESDSIILLYFTRDKSERKRLIEIAKMRGTKHSRNVYGFDIGKKGILIGRSTVSDLKSIIE